MTSVAFATRADAATCHRLLRAQLIEHRMPADEAGIARGIELVFAAHSPAWLVLARRGEHPVGIALTNRNISVERGGEVLWLEELYVTPEARRTGVASALLGFLEEQGRVAGCGGIELEVVPTQTAALALYERHGFEHLDRLRRSRIFPEA